MYSIAEENYIKSIYHLQRSNRNVTTNELAALLQTKPASVTDMLKKLKAKKLLDYEKYYGVRLTSEGRKVALGIVRRHRLWEYFLEEKLGFGWEEVHDIAEQLEHIQHNGLIEKLDAFLGHPRFDPHGDPIPDKQGRMEQQQRLNLMQAPVGQQVELCLVLEQSHALLEMLGKKKLEIGTRFRVERRFDYDNSMEIVLADGTQISVSEMLASNLFVKHIV